MALKSSDGLKAFCDDLASPEPTPGGGTASAAAGAMAASLLSMVCGITLKNKRHQPEWPRFAELKRSADDLAARLLKNADLDAEAYDAVVLRGRERRATPDDRKAAEAYEMAVQDATAVPKSTAEDCIQVLRLAREVAQAGAKSASSDIEAAIALAAAGVDGAVANILVNIPYSDDASFRSRAQEHADRLRREKEGLVAR
jgi:formiminotetrahydrofolate cyclodeaminase